MGEERNKKRKKKKRKIWLIAFVFVFLFSSIKKWGKERRKQMINHQETFISVPKKY